MARRRDEGILEILTKVHWGIGVFAGVVLYVTLKYILPAKLGSGPLGEPAKIMFPKMAPFFALVCFGAAAYSAVNQFLKRRRLDRSSGLPGIQAMSWREFEELVEEAYRRQGYEVENTGGGGPDGGVDLILRKGPELVLVQCKHWNSDQVGVATVRELYGVVKSEDASRGILVTSGRFSDDAWAFAKDKPLQLFNGRALEKMIWEVKNSPAPRPTTAAPVPPVRPATAAPRQEVSCPKCGNAMVLRTARKGARAGEQFWGCSRYPDCQATLQHDG